MSKKQPSQNKGHQNISAQRLIEMRKQGVYKQQSLPVQACLKPLFATVQNVINKMDVVQVSQARDSIIKSSEKIEDLKLSAKQQLPPLYGVGGTAIGGYGALQQVKAPYLPAMEDGKEYCLVLDMDETLLHYYEQKGEGYVRVRPGCEKFLKEMSELYEVCIFTAAMQDYADWALDSNKLGQYIKHRMYR